MKKAISILLTITMVFTMTVTAGAASAKATTMRLAQVENTVTVTKSSGATLSVSEGMKLYSGNMVTTAAKSYAYISLDDTKAAKLDANSKAEISQSGKKLEVKQTAGSLFFNVTVPLKSDETLNIRTSTMTTGVRGTSGWVVIVDHRVAEISLLTGRAEIRTTDPDTGEEDSVVIRGGQRATSYVQEDGQLTPGGENAEIIIETFMEAEVPGFAAKAVEEDPDLQEAITEQTDLSVPLIIGDADERLAEDEAAAEALQQQIDKDLAAMPDVIAVDPLFEEKEKSGSGPTTTTLTGTTLTDADLQAALAAYDRVIIDAGSAATIAGPLNIPAGRSLTNNGTLTNNSNFTINGTFTNNGDINNTGTITNNSGNSFYHNSGGTFANTGTFTNAATGRAVLNGDVNGNGNIENSGAMDISGRVDFGGLGGGGLISNGGTVDLKSGGEVDQGNVTVNGGTLYIGGSISGAVSGALTVGAGAACYLNSGGSVNGSTGATIVNAGNLYLWGGSISGGSSILNNTGRVYNGTADTTGTNATTFIIPRNAQGAATGAYVNVADALEGARAGEIVELTAATTFSSSVTVSGGTAADPVVLDMNGYTLTISNIVVENGGSLKVEGGGVIAAAIMGNAVEIKKGQMHMTGVEIKNDHPSGSVIYLSSAGSTFTMDGGTITAAGNGVNCGSGSSFILHGGSIICGTATSSYAVQGVVVDGSFIMDDGSISSSCDDVATGVLVNGSFTMNGGSISASSNDIAIGVTVAATGDFTKNAGTISATNPSSAIPARIGVDHSSGGSFIDNTPEGAGDITGIPPVQGPPTP